MRRGYVESWKQKRPGVELNVTTLTLRRGPPWERLILEIARGKMISFNFRTTIPTGFVIGVWPKRSKSQTQPLSLSRLPRSLLLVSRILLPTHRNHSLSKDARLVHSYSGYITRFSFGELISYTLFVCPATPDASNDAIVKGSIPWHRLERSLRFLVSEPPVFETRRVVSGEHRDPP